MKAMAPLLATALLAGCAAGPPAAGASAAPPASPASAALDTDARAGLYLGVVEGLIRQRRYEAAIAFLAQYQKARPATPRFEMLSGDALLGAGRTAEAIACYRRALASDMAAAARDGIGRAEAAQGQWAEAAADFRAASSLSPADAAYLNNYAYAEMKQGLQGVRLGPALTALMRAHELAPESDLVRNNLILAARRYGDRAQVSTLLDTISGGGRRSMVAAFADGWTPAEDATVRKGTGS